MPLRVAVLLAVWLTTLLAGPGVAGACACGAVVADQRLTSVQETALVDLTGDDEAITLNISSGTRVDDAAFLMPVPSRARFTLAHGAVFGELDAVSRPRVVWHTEHRSSVGIGNGAGAPAAGVPDVTVTDHVAVGPYDVVQLTGHDSTAVSRWLHRQHFTLSPGVAQRLTPYLRAGWKVVAVRIRPKTHGATFDGGLPPMRIAFHADNPVYPMRLSAAARVAQPLRLYVLAGHRTDVTNPAPGAPAPTLTFAGRLDGVRLQTHVELRKYANAFLTRYDATPPPSLITSDIRLSRSATDGQFRAVVHRTHYVDDPPFGLLIGMALTLLVAFVVGVVVVVAIVVHLTRRRPR